MALLLNFKVPVTYTCLHRLLYRSALFSIFRLSKFTDNTNMGSSMKPIVLWGHSLVLLNNFLRI